MIRMKYKAIKIVFLSSIFVLSLIFLSFSQVRTELQSNYTPLISDTFSYSGTSTNIEFNSQKRIITNTTTQELLDYFDQVLETNSGEITNVNLTIDGITASTIGTSLSIAGISDTTGSYTKNDTKAYNAGTQVWDNQSSTQNLNPSPFNDSQTVDFNYSLGTVPSSMILGDGMNVYIGMTPMPFGDNGQQGQGSSCSAQDLMFFTVNDSGQIDVPIFTNISQISLKGIFDATTFNWTEFDQDNLAYIGNHASDNITWTQVDIGVISGINPSYSGTEVVLVYQIEQNFGTGMLEASDSYCPQGSGDFNPFVYFGDLSQLTVVWTDFQQDNRPYTINGYDYSLTTKTYEGTNQTVRAITVNMSIGDPGSNFYAMVNLTLDLNVSIDFEYDINTGFLVEFRTSFSAKIGMSIDSIEIPLGTSGENGTATMSGMLEAQNNMDFKLTSHSSLYQLPPPTSSTSTSTSTSTTSSSTTTSLTSSSTSTSNTSSSSSSSNSQSTTQTITTDYPNLIFLLAIPAIAILRRKIKR